MLALGVDGSPRSPGCGLVCCSSGSLNHSGGVGASTLAPSPVFSPGRRTSYYEQANGDMVRRGEICHLILQTTSIQGPRLPLLRRALRNSGTPGGHQVPRGPDQPLESSLLRGPWGYTKHGDDRSNSRGLNASLERCRCGRSSARHPILNCTANRSLSRPWQEALKTCRSIVVRLSRVSTANKPCSASFACTWPESRSQCE